MHACAWGGSRVIAALHTSFEQPAFAVGDGGRLAAWACAPAWPADLKEVVAGVLGEAGLAGDAEIAAVAVATGPGRFGAVRGGIAFAKGLALARKAPLVGVPTAVAVVEAVGDSDVSIVLPAGRGRWYVTGRNEDGEIGLVDADELTMAVPADAPVAGPLGADLADELEESGRQVRRVDGEAVLGALVRLAERRLTEGCGPATLGAQPVYAAPATRARPWVRGMPHG